MEGHKQTWHASKNRSDRVNQENGLSNKRALTFHQLKDKDNELLGLFRVSGKKGESGKGKQGKQGKQGDHFLSVLLSWAWQCKQKYVDSLFDQI